MYIHYFVQNVSVHFYPQRIIRVMNSLTGQNITCFSDFRLDLEK